WLSLKVVSYAPPALIAIGQALHRHRPTRNPFTLLLRTLTRKKTLRLLEAIQPSSGGFLEATPLTSFVTMSLAGSGQADAPVTHKGVEFLVRSAREDGSWAIDTNLATWVTTLSVQALGDALPAADRRAVRGWLLGQQYRKVHPYTGAAPGGWAWTDLPGGVPDADDTPGAILALAALPEHPATGRALEQARRWLYYLQNNDGGTPTFCRGWGHLPFDRSGCALTAHAARAIKGWAPVLPRMLDEVGIGFDDATAEEAVQHNINNGLTYLKDSQRPDGSWLPLWFGNQ